MATGSVSRVGTSTTVAKPRVKYSVKWARSAAGSCKARAGVRWRARAVMRACAKAARALSPGFTSRDARILEKIASRAAVLERASDIGGDTLFVFGPQLLERAALGGWQIAVAGPARGEGEVSERTART